MTSELRYVAFSGQGSASRSEYIGLARANGWEVMATVSPVLHAFVVGEDASERKVAQARDLGIEVLSYDAWAAGMHSADAEMTNDRQVGEDLYLPPAYPDDMPAGESQLLSIRELYVRSTFEKLTSDQAGTLLDYRDFARAVLDRVRPDLPRVESRPIVEALSIYISRRRELAQGTARFMRDYFNKGADYDRLPRAIAKLEFFDEIAEECDSLMEDHVALLPAPRR